MPYISYESFEHYRQYSDILSHTRHERGTEDSFNDTIHGDYYDDEAVPSSHSGRKHEASEPIIEEESVIRAYMDYQHDGQDLFLHPRKYVSMTSTVQIF